jgi:hypothetical protein
VYEKCLVDVNSDKIVESGHRARSFRAREGWLFLEAFHGIDVGDLLIVTERKPFFPHGCTANVTAGRRVESSMMFFQISQALVRKLVGTIGRRRLPGMSGDSKQRSCCDGVCEVHDIGSGGISRRVSMGSLTGDDGSATGSKCLEKNAKDI